VELNVTKRHIHLVGSAAFDTVDEVFDHFGEYLGPYADRFPDGEVGDRKNWIMWQARVIQDHPQFESAGARVDPRNPEKSFPLYKLRSGVSPDDIRFGPLGYADEARKSYAIFSRKLADGVLPAGSRFLVALPTPLVFNWAFMPSVAEQELIEPAYERAMLEEVTRIADAVPHDRLAIQWDIAAEMTALERGEWVGPRTGHDKSASRAFPDMMTAFSSRVVRLVNAVPTDIELLIHLCYGDFGHRHSIEPSTLMHCVEMANRISAGATRSIALLHMPVPRDRADDAYFEPLKGLRLRPETVLSLGLIHLTGGVEGTLRRMATADKFVRDYSIATECGLGRRPPETMIDLLKVHAEAARQTST
jgi:methionine synthase II (cobalamin-independent)